MLRNQHLPLEAIFQTASSESSEPLFDFQLTVIKEENAGYLLLIPGPSCGDVTSKSICSKRENIAIQEMAGERGNVLRGGSRRAHRFDCTTHNRNSRRSKLFESNLIFLCSIQMIVQKKTCV
jgi:hypothetical protein